MSDLTYATVADVLRSQRWIFAKTMPLEPHWYTLKRDWSDPALFVEVVRFIRINGYTEIYKRSSYRMLNIDDMKYWTMFATPEQTTLINRTFIDDAARRAAIPAWALPSKEPHDRSAEY